MSGKPGEFEDLVEYLIGRCLEAAEDRDKDSFVEYLTVFNDVIDNYLEQRTNLGQQASSNNSKSLDRIFSNYFVELYEELLETPPVFRTETISAITTSIHRSRDVGFPSTYKEFLSILNGCYRVEMGTGEFEFRAKRLFVRRYELIISKSINELQTSDSSESFDLARTMWGATFEQVRKLLKMAIEATDEETYSQIVSKLMDIHYYDVISSGPQGITEAQAGDDEFSERKSQLGRNIESQISLLTFMLTGWAFRRLQGGTLSRDEYSEIANTTESQRNSLAAVADLYYKEIREEGRLGYWEEWNLEEALAETMGAATSSPAALSWIKEFYCAELLRVGSQSFEGGELDIGENPIPASKAVIGESDTIREVLESLNEDSIAEYITGPQLDIVQLMDEIERLHEEAEETYREQVRKEVQETELDEEVVESFKNSVQSGFVESCTLRNVLRDIGVISEGPTDEGELQELGRLRVPRRSLVSVDDIPVHLSVQRYVSPIEDRYQELLFKELDIERERVSSQNELLDRIREFVDTRDVEAILTTTGTRTDVFGDADAYQYVLTADERVFENQRGSFAETPVLSMRGDEFSVLVLFAGPIQVLESNPPNAPLKMNLIPAEETLSQDEREDLSQEELENVKDWVYAAVMYPCRFRAELTLGVAITLER